ncbi:MAG: MATE family efflux transporter [Alphaproteobacteria bacterium]|nr:MATE family efflux transporter [Alphaproteobacteria bacterium]
MTTKPLPYANRGDLTTGDVQKHLVRMTVPMIWGLMAVISVQLVDTYFVSMLGTRELAGISFTFPVTMLISHLVFGLNIALSSVVSRLLGEKKQEDAKRVVLHGIILSFTVSAIIALLCYIFLEPLFRKLGADDETLPVVYDYMPLWLAGSAVLAIPVNANSALRAAGDTVAPAWVMISIALINLVLAPLFIFGWLGVPALGVFGAALATFLSYWFGLVGALYVLIFKKHMVSTDGLHLDKFKDSLKRLAVIAVPAGITNIIMPAASAVVTALIAKHGPEAVAAYGVATRVEAFSMLFVIALALGMAPIVGQNWGAGKYERVNAVITKAIQFNFIWSFFVALIFALFARHIGRAFSDHEEVIHYVTLFFWIVPFTYGFGNLVFGWSSAFNAMGQPQRALVMISLKAFVFTIPAVLLGSAWYGIPGIFVALALVNLLSGALFHWMSMRTTLKEEQERQALA